MSKPADQTIPSIDAKPKSRKQVDVRTSLEVAGVLIAVFSLALSFLIGKEQGRTATLQIARDARMDSVTMIETVSRYMSIMSGYATLETGEKQAYSAIAGQIDTGSGKIRQLSGKLEINQPVVQTLISLAEAISKQELDKSRANELVETTIAEPLKAFATSIDPTIVGGSLNALAQLQEKLLLSGSVIPSFSNSALYFIVMKDRNLEKFNLASADFRHSQLERIRFGDCMLSSSNSKAIFDHAKILEMEVAPCGNGVGKQSVSLQGAELGKDGAPGVRLLGGSTFGVDLTGAFSNGTSPALECVNATLIVSGAVGAKLTNSQFFQCNADALEIPNTATLAGSKIAGGSYVKARFGANALADVKITGGDFSGAQFAFSGLDVANAMAEPTHSLIDVSDAIMDESQQSAIRDLLNRGKVQAAAGATIWIVSSAGQMKGIVMGGDGDPKEYIFSEDIDAIKSARDRLCKKDSSRCGDDWFKAI